MFHVKPRRRPLRVAAVDEPGRIVDNHAQRAIPDRWKTWTEGRTATPGRLGRRLGVPRSRCPTPSGRVPPHHLARLRRGRAPGLLAGVTASGQDTRAGSAQATRTATVVDASRST